MTPCGIMATNDSAKGLLHADKKRTFKWLNFIPGFKGLAIALNLPVW